MRILRSVGFGVLLLILAVAMPRVFHALEDTFLSLLSALQTVLHQTEILVASPATLNVPTVFSP
jgi:hypothetical protein